ncbi:CarboxypepD_reg-like domain-containing protein [Salegentibacter holothuriorum]|uniref:CarboxypepD_reg-like domain-containing protein n=1 Tax=Salegentibacter holothuriorum TaxID=241145 RepID=A0A1T5ELE0_9FLAO|nr:outer membrane beta-barrel protein [Salegentibacter holothuriorum]SKB84675.1 CarboxypepD_reg-like domain-containing protein [Salegentibacter holothuriorum]
MRILLSFALLFLVGNLTAQNFEINGIVTSPEGEPLESATVYLEKPADSSLVTYTISDKSGSFQLAGKGKPELINLLISYAGFKTHSQKVEIAEELNLGTIKMQVADNALDEITITSSRAPVTIKRDTLEFNADSFNTRQDANLEELMRKLPGVEVSNNGEITINGKPVSRILVNGEEFFGDDPKIATKNLPKEIIDKIQVTDTKTRSEEFTGKAGDPDNKTVNITVKEDKNKGYFSRATAGGGTNERYELSAIGNYFKDNLRLSVLTSSNNINSSGFSYDEVYGMMGRSSGRNVFGSNGGGITKAETAGLNFVNKWDDKIKLSADYFFGKNDTERRTSVQRENILPDSRYFTNSNQESNLINNSHRANVRFEVEFDSLTRLSIRPNFNINSGNSLRNSFTESLDGDQNLINNTETFDNEELQSANFNNGIDFIKRFGSRGAYLQMEFSNNHSRQENDNFYYSESVFFENNEEVTEIQDQFIDEDQDRNSYNFEANQRSVLADQLFFDVSYDFEYENATNKRYVYESEGAVGTYNSLNQLLSSDFEVISRRHIPSLGLNYEGETWRINTNFGLLHTSLENNNFLESTTFENTYDNLFMRAEVRYEIERSKSLSIRYDTDVNIPSINQLQPVVNRTNPLNIIVGNPELSPTYEQNIRLNYRNYNFATRTGVFSWLRASFTNNNVVSVTTINEDLVRNTTYTNVDGAVNLNLGSFYSKQYKVDGREFRYRAGLNGNYNKNIGFTNAVQYKAERYSVSPSIRLTYGIEELFDLNPSYELTYNSTKYDINANRNEDFINHRIGFEATSYWPKNVVFGNDISYNYFGNVSPGFDNTSLLWNMSLGYQFLNDDATLKVTVFDVLDQNIDTRRTIGDDFIQDSSSLILTQYAMLSFTYKLSNFGGGSMPNSRMRRR